MRVALWRPFCVRFVLGVLIYAIPGALGVTSPGWAQPAKLVIYTDQDPRLIEFLIGVFQIEQGVSVRTHFGDSIDYQVARRKDPSFAVDVFVTVNARWLHRLSQTGELAALESETLRTLIPELLRDPDGYWFGFSQRVRAFHVASDRISHGVPDTFESLADPQWRGRLCSRSLSHPHSTQMIAAMIDRYGVEETRAWLAALRANLVEPISGDDRAQLRRAASGVCDIAIANSDQRGLMSEVAAEQEFVAATEMVLPTFADNTMHVTLMAGGVHADSREKETAVAFLEFLASEKGQRMLMRLSYEHPVVSGIALEGAVAEWGPLSPDELNVSWLEYLIGEAQSLAAKTEALAAKTE